MGNPCTQCVLGEEAPYVHLIGSGLNQLVVAVAGSEMPLCTKVVIQTCDCKIGGVGERNVGLESLFIDPVAVCPRQAAASRVIRQRLELVPHLRNQGIDSDASGITSGGSGRTTIHSGIQVVLHAPKRKDTRAHARCRNRHLVGGRVLPTEALVIGKEIGLSSQNALWNDRPATGGAKAVVVIARQRCTGEVILPGVGIKLIVKIILVGGAMPGISAALGDHLNLRARGIIEVSGLVGGIDFKFLDAVNGGGQDAGGSAVKLVSNDTTRRIAAEAWGVDRHTAVHIISVLAAIEHEGALVSDRASHASVGGNAWLQGHKGAAVLANRRQTLQEITRYRIANRGIHGLEFGVGSGNLDGFGNRAQLKLQVDSQWNADTAGYDGLGGTETALTNGDFIISGRHVGKKVATRIVGNGWARRVRRFVRELDRSASDNSACGIGDYAGDAG